MWLRLVRFHGVCLPGLAEWFFCVLQTTVRGLCVMFLALARAAGGTSFSILSWCISSFLHPVFPEPLLSTSSLCWAESGGTPKMSRPRLLSVGLFSCRRQTWAQMVPGPEKWRLYWKVREPGRTLHPAREQKLEKGGSVLAGRENMLLQTRRGAWCKGPALIEL